MGKNLKGKELGKGISQRKDGLISARFTSQSGKRIENYFHSVPEAKRWLEDAKYEDRHSLFQFASQMTVDEWFEYWLRYVRANKSDNTRRNDNDRYVLNFQPIIGNMPICEVRPMHCMRAFDNMTACYAPSTIEQAYSVIGKMFKDAMHNGLIQRHPFDGIDITDYIGASAEAYDEIQFMTIEEQNAFLETVSHTHNYRQIVFLLETGVRIGELIGLTWEDIDWEKHTVSINKSIEYRYKFGEWRAHSPKSKKGYRVLPLTQKAYDILREIFDERETRKQSTLLENKLEFKDRKTKEMRTLSMKDLVFLNFRTGEPTKNSSYDSFMYRMCDKAGIPHFSVHDLRHTYATRAIERGVPPKVLQELLGHASLKTTMDLYVHNSNESLVEGVRLFEQGEKNGVRMA